MNRRSYISGLAAVATALLAGSAPACEADRPARQVDRSSREIDRTGTGWKPTHLDLHVSVEPDEESLTLAGDLVLRLEGHGRSGRLTLVMNSRDSIMAFDSVSTDRGVVAEVGARHPDRPPTRAVHVDFPNDPPARGDEIRLRVHASSRKTAQQFTLADDVALASWVTAWYPIPLPFEGHGLGPVAKAPGETSFDLPPGWRVVSNGVRTASHLNDERTRETWTARRSLARSFAAAPYRVTGEEVDRDRVELFLLTVGEAAAREQTRALAGSIAALERRFGPYPTGAYAIAEVPEWVPGFLASSEQGFMMAKPENFKVPGGNIPLFAHEAAHGYWGNLVTSRGQGSSFLDESMSQYGAVIALEEMLGPGAAKAFLRFSREGYIPLQSARGYFEVVRRGADSVAIAELEDLNGVAKRIVVNSKGTWVLHMLRDRVGDARFFATLRDYLEAHAGGTATLDDFRDGFRRAAPEEDLVTFFTQWLDRTGAPRFDVSWEADGDEVEVVIEQVHDGEPYILTLDVRVSDPGGGAATHRVPIGARRETVRLPAPRGVEGVSLDPEFKILRWDESYRMEGG